MEKSSRGTPLAVKAEDVEPRIKPSSYPEPFFTRMANREKRVLGDLFGIKNFGVNLTKLLPGGESSILHRHSKQDEFIYIIEGRTTLVTDEGEVELSPGMCAGFPAGGVAHQLVNRTKTTVTYLELGDRTPGDEGTYPFDDLHVTKRPDGNWLYTHKDGTPY
jgi:uncharacterized cupin superfamily protein